MMKRKGFLSDHYKEYKTRLDSSICNFNPEGTYAKDVGMPCWIDGGDFDQVIKDAGGLINWRRTGAKEYPKEGQKCLIYFAHTGFSLSTFSWEENDLGTPSNPSIIKTAVFSDSGGFLGDEDVLWIPLSELKKSLFSDYVNDCEFMRWNDPRAIIKKVVLLKDHVRDEGAIYTKDFVPAGTELSITCENPATPEIYAIAVYRNENRQLCQCFKIPKSICKDLTYSCIDEDHYIYEFYQTVPSDREGDPAYEKGKFYFKDEVELLNGPYNTAEEATQAFIAYSKNI